jgi:hypothetical protein
MKAVLPKIVYWNNHDDYWDLEFGRWA